MTKQSEAEWEPLRRAVGRVIGDGRLGRPAVVRCLLRAGGGPDEIAAGVERLTALATEWFESEPSASYSVGNRDQGHVITSLRFPGGQTALVSVGAGPRGDSGGGNLMVLGSRGALYFDIPESMGGGG
ncbi:MAG: hypothetical protein HQ548_08685 [Chloroflexi bacterium]|nr:hypothetical protein [Chloroflexota bacterium]